MFEDEGEAVDCDIGMSMLVVGVDSMDSAMSQMATKPFAQPTASSVADSHVKHVQTVSGGRD